MLFIAVLAAVCCGSAVAPAFPLAAPAVGASILGLYGLAMLRRALVLRQGSYGPAPVGPLSPDEKAKARSKLVGTSSRGLRY
jgi:hypothetical protein